MARIDGEIVIGRPVDAVLTMSLTRAMSHGTTPRMVRVEKITPGPVGKGTRFCSAVASRGPAQPEARPVHQPQSSHSQTVFGIWLL
jgi:hypothetical protein